MPTVTLIIALIAAPSAIIFLVLFIQAKAIADTKATEIDRLRQDGADKDKRLTEKGVENKELTAALREAKGKVAIVEARIQPLQQHSLAISKSEAEILRSQETLVELQKKIISAQAELAVLTEAQDLTDIAFFVPSFRESDSEAYRRAIEANAERQKAMIQSGTAASCSKNWTVGGDAKAGERMVKALTKLAMRAFNGESDASVGRVTWKNYETMKKRIEKSFEVINDLVEHWQISISQAFLEMKLEELQLTYEQEEMRQRERDEQKALKEQMREEERARQEAERAKQEAEREERIAEAALAKARIEMARAREEDQAVFKAKVADLEGRLAEAHRQAERATSMAQLTKRGFVYIISNIGAFGEGIFKIGMTRRLVPQDRIDELGDASVPFDFDVHAMVETDDAPKLEADFHRNFSHRRVNLINLRKEFFKVTIEGIQSFCAESGFTLQLTMLAEAKEFRQSQSIRLQQQQAPAALVIA